MRGQPVHEHVARGSTARLGEAAACAAIRDATSAGSRTGSSGTKKTPSGKSSATRRRRPASDEPRLAGAARPGQREEPWSETQAADLGPSSASRPTNVVSWVGRLFGRASSVAQRRELALQAVGRELGRRSGSRRSLSRCCRGRGGRRPSGSSSRTSEPRIASETRIWPPWAAAAIRAARLMSRPTSGPPCDPRLAGVEAHPDADRSLRRATARRRARAARRRRPRRPRARCRKTTKNESPSVPCSSPPCGRERGTEELPVTLAELRVRRACRSLLQPGRALDVGEQERQRRIAQVGHLDGRLDGLEERGRFLHLCSGHGTSETKPSSGVGRPTIVRGLSTKRREAGGASRRRGDRVRSARATSARSGRARQAAGAPRGAARATSRLRSRAA